MCDEMLTEEQIDDDGDRMHDLGDESDTTLDIETYREASDIGL